MSKLVEQLELSSWHQNSISGGRLDIVISSTGNWRVVGLLYLGLWIFPNTMGLLDDRIGDYLSKYTMQDIYKHIYQKDLFKAL